jgi:hypothetical protein
MRLKQQVMNQLSSITGCTNALRRGLRASRRYTNIADVGRLHQFIAGVLKPRVVAFLYLVPQPTCKKVAMLDHVKLTSPFKQTWQVASVSANPVSDKFNDKVRLFMYQPMRAFIHFVQLQVWHKVI